MKCPVCDSNMSTLLCSCGYDASRDYEKHPTFGPVGKAVPASVLRARRAPKDALRCAQCGGSNFIIRIPENTRHCAACGWSPDPKAHIACACGGRYFTVRAADGALMCPLCSRDIPLDDLIARVRPAPVRATEPPKLPAKSITSVSPSKPENTTSAGIPALFPTKKPAEAQPKHSLLDRYGKNPAVKPLRPSGPVITAIAAGYLHTVALYSDGTVAAVGSNNYHQCDVTGWKDIIAIAAGGSHTVGLKKDGTVVATGDNHEGQCDVTDWTNVTSIAAGDKCTMAIRRNNTYYCKGFTSGTPMDLYKAKRPVAIAAGSCFTAALDRNGTVTVTAHSTIVGSFRYHVKNWRDITAIAANHDHIIGLRSDGTPVSFALNPHSKSSISWTNIQAIAAGGRHTVGLKKDGTVVTAGSNDDGQCNVSDWRDITAIAAGVIHTVGLKRDGTLIATGANHSGQCDVDKLIKR